MSAGSLTGFRSVFERYLNDVVANTDAMGAPVELPDHPQPVIQPDDLERALNNPRVLFYSIDQNEPREQLRLLCTFALWLRYSPPGHVPPHLESRAARLRFAVWTLPPRTGWQEWRPLPVEWSSSPGGYIQLSREMVLAEARAARDDWLAQLNAREQDPWLAARHQREPMKIESDLRWLTTTWPRPRRDEPAWPDGPSYLNLEPDGDEDRSAYQQVDTALAELHFLPQGSLRAASAALLPDRPVVRLLTWLFPLAALVVVGLFVGTRLPATVLAAVGLSVGTLVTVAIWSALGLLALGLVAAGLIPTRLIGLALLRIPAAAAVGQVVLLSLTPRWWLAPSGWTVGTGLLGVAALYLVLESRLHGALRRWAYPRGLLIAGIGALYAFLLSLVVLAFVAPSVAERGECLVGWWSADPWSARPLTNEGCDGQAAAPAGVLLLMTGWSLAVGLAAQILWDDRPVTAPLGRLRRVRGSTP
ncbi:MAG: hypothetical protein ACT4NY_19360 [Pseudonocardiales bacterium]